MQITADTYAATNEMKKKLGMIFNVKNIIILSS